MWLEVLVVYNVPQRSLMLRWLFGKPLKLQSTEEFFYIHYVYDLPESKDMSLGFFEGTAAHSVK